MTGSEEPPHDAERDSQSAFASFQHRLQRGESIASRALIDEYSAKLVHLAGQHIHPALLKRFDGEDVVQSVFRSFFRRNSAQQFEIERSQQLWQLLVTLTLCKARSQARRHTAARRNARTVSGIEHEQILDREPRAEDALSLWEEIDAVLEGLPQRAGTILTMRLEGRNRSEIAESLGLSRQTIHRILKLLQNRLNQRLELFADEIPS